MSSATPFVLILVALFVACGPGALEATTPAASTPAPSHSATAPDPVPTPPDAAPTPSAEPTPSAADGSAPPNATWARLDAPGPGAREDHTWTVDEAGQVAYLFGGRAGSKSRADLWRYDLADDTWQRLDPSGPAPKARFGHGAAWVPGVGLVVWAGQAGSAFFDDLWAYDPAAGTWRELPSAGAVPEARYGSCAVLGGDGRLWISHGFTDQGRFFDTRAYDFVAGRWTDETPDGPTPVERCLHDCLWASDGRLLLYAGQTNGVPALGDLWTFDTRLGAWTEQEPTPRPSVRQLYALATLGETAWVFGGRGKGGDPLADLWTLDLATLGWQRAAVSGRGPAARSGAALIADPARDRLLLFGGLGQKDEQRDIWQLALSPTD